MQNLHNHTTFSDGKYSPEDVVKAAIKAKLETIGISDHYKTRKLKSGSVTPENIPEYLESIRALKEKYSRQIRVLAGIEIDSSLLRTNYTEMPFNEINRCDYALMEYIDDNDMLGLCLDEFLKLRPLFTCKIGLAHCDVEKHFGRENYDRLLDVLEKHEIFIEMCPSKRNARWGTTPYYLVAEEFFDKIASRNIFVSIGTDMHDELSEVANVTHAVDFMRFGRLQKNLLFAGESA